MRTLVVIALTMWVGACAVRASNPPALLVDRSSCSRCGMLISERAYAAAIRLADGHDELFDDIGCLVASLEQRKLSGAKFWFHDAADGEWISDVDPVFVTAPALRTPMGGGIAAYRDRKAAEEAAVRLGGRVVPDVQALSAAKEGAR
jgi:copper chaperone NosL